MFIQQIKVLQMFEQSDSGNRQKERFLLMLLLKNVTEK